MNSSSVDTAHDSRRRSSHRSSRRSHSRSSHRRDRSRSKERNSTRHRSSRDRRSRSRDRDRRRSRDRSERHSSKRSRSRSSTRVVRRRKKSNFDVRPPGVTEENAAAYAAQAILQQNMAALSGSVGPASFGAPPTPMAPTGVSQVCFFPCSSALFASCVKHMEDGTQPNGEIQRLTRCRCVFRCPLSVHRGACFVAVQCPGAALDSSAITLVFPLTCLFLVIV